LPGLNAGEILYHCHSEQMQVDLTPLMARSFFVQISTNPLIQATVKT